MMTQTRLAERLIETTPWATLRSADGTVEGVGLAPTQLLRSESPDEAESAYWRIENHAFIQEDIFEVAVACTSVLVGRTDQLRTRCHQAAREGLRLLVREAVFARRDPALEILELLGEGAKSDRCDPLRRS